MNQYRSIVSYANSPEGQKIGQAAFNFIRDSGVGQTGANYVNEKVKKRIKNPILNVIREKVHEKVSKALTAEWQPYHPPPNRATPKQRPYFGSGRVRRPRRTNYQI
jgi:hypothetical protein